MNSVASSSASNGGASGRAELPLGAGFRFPPGFLLEVERDLGFRTHRGNSSIRPASVRHAVLVLVRHQHNELCDIAQADLFEHRFTNRNEPTHLTSAPLGVFNHFKNSSGSVGALGSGGAA